MTGNNTSYDKYEILYGTVFFFIIFGIAYPMVLNLDFHPYNSLMLAIGFLFFMLMSKGLSSFLSGVQMSTENKNMQCVYSCKALCCGNNDCDDNNVDSSCYDKCNRDCNKTASFTSY